jgi:hypothetical protein
VQKHGFNRNQEHGLLLLLQVYCSKVMLLQPQKQLAEQIAVYPQHRTLLPCCEHTATHPVSCIQMVLFL